MATVTKKKAKAKAKAKASGKARVTPIELDKVDQYVNLDRKIAAAEAKLKPYKAKRDELNVELLEFVDATTKPLETKTLEGEEFSIEFSAKGKTTDITDKIAAAKMLEKVKKGLAMELATFGITALKDYLTPEQMKEISKEDPRNARRKTITELVDDV